MKKHIFILSGPTAVGKTTIIEQLLLTLGNEIEKVCTTTTRDCRPEEIHGQHYYFVSEDIFRQTIEQGEFIEWAFVHGKAHYGSTFSELERIVRQSKGALFCIDVQGMLLAKPLLLSRGYDVHTIFLTPPNLQTLRDRLALRPGITEDEIEHRLKSIAYEMEISQQYDTIFINDLLDDCVREVAQYIRSKLS